MPMVVNSPASSSPAGQQEDEEVSEEEQRARKDLEKLVRKVLKNMNDPAWDETNLWCPGAPLRPVPRLEPEPYTEHAVAALAPDARLLAGPCVETAAGRPRSPGRAQTASPHPAHPAVPAVAAVWTCGLRE